MSRETLEQFIQQISDSEELQARVGDEIDTESLITLGAEYGCEFTADDLTVGAELSDEELGGVAGGVLSMPIGVNFRRKSNGNFSFSPSTGHQFGNTVFDDEA